MMSDRNLKMALCEGRHEIFKATDGAIFGNVIDDVTETYALEESAFNSLWNAAFRHYKAGESGYLTIAPDWDGYDGEPLEFVKGLTVDLYVTGLTVALIAAINVCYREGLRVKLWHFDRESGSYFPQMVK